MESQSLRKRQTILVEKRGQRVAQNFATRDSAVRRRMSGTHMRNFSRQPPSGLDGVQEASEPSDENDIIAALNQPGVDPEAYLVRALAGASLDEIKAYEEQLAQHLQQITEREQSSLRHNYDSMRTVAQALSDLGPQVGELRRQVGELYVVSEAIRQDAQTAQSLPTRRSRTLSQASIEDQVPLVGADHRQSMLMLNNAWAQDLLRLFSRVEGAQRYLPATPGRHIVLESQGWHELNVVTWQPVKACVLFLLNDHLLVATPRPQLVVDECWPLADITVDHIEKTLRVRTAQSHHHAYRTVNSTKMRAFLGEFAKARDQLQAQRQAQIQAQMQTDSVQHDQLSSHGTEPTTTLERAASTRSRNGVGSKHARQMSTDSYLNDVPVEVQREAARIVADIDREIAYRHWDEATTLCLEHNNHNLVGETVMQRQERVGQLILDYMREWSDRMSKKEKIDIIQLLVRLGRGKQARQTFLDAVTSQIESRTREVHFMGDVVSYVSQMAVIYFQMIRAAVEVYRTVFQAKEDSSVIVTWAKSQVDLYATVFERQLYRIPTHTRSYKQCMEVSRRESSQLHRLSMDMDFMLRYVWDS